MTDEKMHADEVPTSTDLVRRLLHAQHPHWADRRIELVRASGSDNVLYRLRGDGADLVVRLPRKPSAVDGVEKELVWLPRLAPFLPLAVPEPVARGVPGEGYPFPWAVYRWLEGEDATRAAVTDFAQAARDLAWFIRALREIDPTSAPLANRGLPLPLHQRDEDTRSAIDALRECMPTFEADAAYAAWDAVLRLPPWSGPAVWIHSDLMPLNLLVRDGRLSAILDWGGCGAGDPACDLIPAWSFLPATARPAFRAALGVDDITWARGRGWALTWSLVALPYYRTTNLGLAAVANATITAVLADQRDQ